LVWAAVALVAALAAVLWVAVHHTAMPGEPQKPQHLAAPPGVPVNNIAPLPPPFGNATGGCAGWYIMMYLREHGWRPGMPPPMLPMICWASIPQSMVQGITNAAGGCMGVGCYAVTRPTSPITPPP
jgi:membrane associated rhomboid family serine protease